MHPAAFLRISAIGLSVLLAGCTVGPDFTPPAAPAASAYLPPEPATPLAGGPQAVAGIAAPRRWWTAFGSASLDALVDRAIAGNRSLQASNATLARARAELRAVRGTRLPQVDANARIDREQVNLAGFGFSGDATGIDLGGNPEFGLYTVGAGISYDLDLFGGGRRRVEQAAAQAEAQLRQTEAAHLTLAGQVVNQALLVAATRSRIETLRTLIGEDERNATLVERRRRGGEGTLVEVLNAQSQLAADRADLPQLDQQLAEARHMLAVLVGAAPADADLPDLTLDQLTLPATIPLSLPSDLVHVRPDIRQAEADLHAATASIGIATARLYPNITLGATITQGSPDLDTLLRNAFRGYDLFGGLTAPIFHGGTLKAERTAAIAGAQAAEATYQQTILQAFGQVADLLSALRNDQQSLLDQRRSLDVAARSLALSRRSFEVGNSGVLSVLDAERVYQRALSGVTDARARQYLNVARLFVATGGGWLAPPVEPTAVAAAVAR